MRRLPLLALPLMLAACGDAPEEEGQGVTPEAEAPMEGVTLDLQGTGIVVPRQNGFEELAVPFGSSKIPTEATLGNVLGAVVEKSETPNDCGLTFTSFDGLTLNFRDDEFVGYRATSPYADIGTRADLLADDNFTMVEGSTIGEEFTIGFIEGPTIAGLFSGSGDDAGVEALWAGENCIGR